MTTKQAARKAGLTPNYLRKRAKVLGVLPRKTVATGRVGRPSLLWSERQMRIAAGAV